MKKIVKWRLSYIQPARTLEKLDWGAHSMNNIDLNIIPSQVEINASGISKAIT